MMLGGPTFGLAGLRVMRVFVALALCVPLGGCFSLTGPKPLPEWAMSPHQQEASATQARPRQRAIAQHQPRQVDVADSGGTVVGNPTNVRPARLAKRVTRTAPERARAAQPADVTAFTPEWQAREDAAEARLRRSMRICSGC
jgi:hypothetical protein